MSAVAAIVSDFGGVLTSPLAGSFEAFREASGISPADLGAAMARIAERDGAHPLTELETGRITEAAFLDAIGAELTATLDRPVDLRDFGERYFAHLQPNQPMIAFMRSLRARGYRLALCTNNVREWEARWRALVPVDELFEVVVDSAFVGTRKPEPRIYELTLERLSVSADAALFIDDVTINCDGARRAGMRAVHFRTAEQAIAETEAALRDAD